MYWQTLFERIRKKDWRCDECVEREMIMKEIENDQRCSFPPAGPLYLNDGLVLFD